MNVQKLVQAQQYCEQCGGYHATHECAEARKRCMICEVAAPCRHTPQDKYPH